MNYFLTEERLQELKSELNTLKTSSRVEISERLKRAKELGDLSENADYHEAKEEQSKIEGRIDDLEQIIQNSVIIKKDFKKDSIDVGSNIEVSRSGKKIKFQIVGSNETKPEDGLISNESPLGRALIGKRVGDSVSIQTPQGNAEYKVLNIS